MPEDPSGRLGRRLGRILVLLPYAIQHPGVTVSELANKFGVDKSDLLDDLNLVFLCGLPGYGPGDLIDVDLQEDRVYVRMADYFAAPLKLTPTEALALYAGAAALAEEETALQRAVEKLGRALGVSGGNGGPGVSISLEPTPAGHQTTLRDAIARKKQVHMEYFSASRSELSERTVDPWGLVAARGHWYLIGGDHRSGEERMFRLDRIKTVTETDTDAHVPEEFDPEEYKGAFRPVANEQTISFEISPAVATWFEDYYPVTQTSSGKNGWRKVELIASSDHWAAILVLQLGNDVREVEPESVVEAARALAAQLTVLHS